MHKLILITLLTIISFGGCAKIDPLSPNLKQELQNQNGKIEELKNNQNGLMLELGKIRNDNQMNAQEIKDAQQGLLNLKGMQNSGIQFFSGDGGLIAFLALIIMSFLFVLHYRSRATRSEQAADVLAQQIALRQDDELEDNVFLSVLNTPIEEDVYHLIKKYK